jgi:hypothetical protein
MRLIQLLLPHEKTYGFEGRLTKAIETVMIIVIIDGLLVPVRYRSIMS